MDRILVLMAADSYHDADRALRSARDAAASAQRISYGLTLMEEPDQAAMQDMLALGTVQFLTQSGDPWRAMPALWQGEGYVLIAHQGMHFTRHWDIALLHALRSCNHDKKRTHVLTGLLPSPADPVEAVAPVAARGFDGSGRLCFQPGTPLRYARHPMPGAFLNPYFCFGPAAFFQEMATEEAPLFLAAFRRGWTLHTLHKPCIHMTFALPLPPCEIPAEEGRATGLARFDAKYNVRLQEKRLSPMARCGIFTSDLRFPIHVPVMVKVQERLREMKCRTPAPLCVTARLNLPGEPLLPEESLARFSRLAAMKNLPLLCFADSSTARRLMRIHPNVLDYKSRYGLPVQTVLAEEEKLNFLRLSKIFLVAQGREKYLSHSHYAWIDFDYLPYPVYARASLDWQALCQDKAVIATVRGRPDPTMFVLPEHLIGPIGRGLLAICEEALQKGLPLPREEDAMSRLVEENPAWFTTIDRPRIGALLDMTMMTREEEFHVLA